MTGFQPIADVTDNRVLDLLENEDFAFSMRGWKGDAADFFAPTPANRAILEERQHFLDSNSDLYCGALDGARKPLEETATLAETWTPATLSPAAREPLDRCRQLGRLLEPDFILLISNSHTPFRAVAGAVCFPSSWDFRHILGKPIHEIHGVVPGLNDAIGKRIDSLLQKLKPGESWSRLNWGISLSPERNQHPSLHLPRLSDAETVSNAWLRVELQVLFKLPASRAILFGIRPVSVSLKDFAHTPPAAALKRQLGTMSPALLDYKGIGKNARLLDPWL